MNLATRFRDAPIRTKLMLTGYLSLTVVLLSVGLMLIAGEVFLWHQKAVSDLEASAEILGSNAAPAIVFDDAQSAAETLHALTAKPEIDFCAIYDKNGKLFALYRPLGSRAETPATAPTRELMQYSLKRMSLSRRIVFKGEAVGWIHLQSDLSGLYKELITYAGLLLVATFIAFFVGTFLLTRLQKVIVEPIQGLATTMTGISEKQDYSLRAEVVSRDEVGLLSLAFNTMLEAIHSRDAQLAKHRDQLEEDIAQRTADLQNANVLLEQELTERERVQLSLRESEERFRSAFESAAIGMAIVSLDGQWLRVNQSLCRMIGYSSEELLRTDFQSITHPEDLKADLDQLRMLTSGEISHYQMEKRYFHKNGSIVWILLSVSMIHAKDGSPDHFIVLIENITERKSAVDALGMRTHELEITNLELERSNRELEQFAFASSHDLQTPIRAIVGFSQLLEKNYLDKLDADASDYIKQIVTSARRMQRLVQSLLEYSLISNSPDRHWINLNHLVDEAQEQLLSMTEGKTVVFDCQQLPTLYADARQLTLLFRNLISNAIKFQPGDHPTVRIAARQGPQEWVLSVSDNGIGIEPQYQQRIFQMFQRLNSPDQYEGDGIGLAMCEKIIRIHGGKLWLESEPGKGSTFFFSIPDNADNG